MSNQGFDLATVTAMRELKGRMRAPSRKRDLTAKLERINTRLETEDSPTRIANLEASKSRVEAALVSIAEHGMEKYTGRPVGFFANMPEREA